MRTLKNFFLTIPPEISIFADSSYTDCGIEDDIKDADAIKMMVHRKSNSKRPDKPYIIYLKNYMRKRIETTFSEVKALFLRKILAITFKGLLIKVLLFVMATTLNKLRTPDLSGTFISVFQFVSQIRKVVN